jgi:rubrerythrin
MQFENLNDIIAFAMEREKEAADFYREASQKEMFSGSRDMLLEFAAQEDKHYNMLQAFMNNTLDKSLKSYKLKWIPDIKRSDYVDAVEYTPGMAYKDMLMLAMKREENALKLYNELLAKAENDAAQKLFKVLCQEEAKHKLSLETLYDDYMAEMGD